MKEIDLLYRTMYAELAQRCFDASFDATWPETGNFVKVPVKGRAYWYFDDARAETKRRYIGPVDDEAITQRVTDFKRIKDDFRGRRKLVSTLTREAGLQAPERMTGDIIEALERAGLFRLRAVLVGTVAFQTYSAYLGVRLPGVAMQTGDADIAQFHSISAAVEDSLPPILDILHSVDISFRPLPHMGDSRPASQYTNAANYKVEFLTPNRGSDDHSDKPAPMPALGGTAAQPLRFLDFLIYEPVRAVMLHKGGISVLVPAPERFAVHKFIVASRRPTDANGIAKRDKDVRQAFLLFDALATTRGHAALADAFAEAWNCGPHWRTALSSGMGMLRPTEQAWIDEVLRAGLRDIGETLEDY